MQERVNRFIIDNIYEEDNVNFPVNEGNDSNSENTKTAPTIESFQEFVFNDSVEEKADNFIDQFKMDVQQTDEVNNQNINPDSTAVNTPSSFTTENSEIKVDIPTYEPLDSNQSPSEVNSDVIPEINSEVDTDVSVYEPENNKPYVLVLDDVSENSPEIKIDVPLQELENNEQPILELNTLTPEINSEVDNDVSTYESENNKPYVLVLDDVSETNTSVVNEEEKENSPTYDAKENNVDDDSSNTKNAFESGKNLQDMINKILRIDNLEPVKVEVAGANSKDYEEERRIQEQIENKRKEQDMFQDEISKVLEKDTAEVVFKSDLLEKLNQKVIETNQISILAKYGEDYCSKDFVTNPAIGRDNEIKQLILTLLTPEKSAILVGKPGIGKTSIVEGLAYRLERNLVPAALQGYTIINIKTPSLIGTLPTGETRLQTLVDELKTLDKVILFIDEIHMLIGATNDSSLDFANMFKEGLGRGQIKVIGATTTEEYERYILRDKAFVRRFQTVEVLEPTREHTIKILMGTLPKIEKETGAKMKYTRFIQSEIMAFITDITSEYKRVYGIGSRYPDICLNLLKEAFSQCIFNNRNEVTIFDVKNAILNSKNIYPDVIRKELVNFNEKFKKIIDEEINQETIDQL